MSVWLVPLDYVGEYETLDLVAEVNLYGNDLTIEISRSGKGLIYHSKRMNEDKRWEFLRKHIKCNRGLKIKGLEYMLKENWRDNSGS